jgi:hypothetical protein
MFDLAKMKEFSEGVKPILLTIVVVSVFWAGLQTALQARPTREEVEPRIRVLENHMIDTTARLRSIDDSLREIKAALR